MDDEYADKMNRNRFYVFAEPVSGPASLPRRLTVFWGGEKDMEKWFTAGLAKEDWNIH